MSAATEPLADPSGAAAGEPDIHTTAGKLADLHQRVAAAVHAGTEAAVARQHAKGRQTARERIDQLLDPGSFVELDALTRHRSTNFGMEAKRPFGDGVVTGTGTVDGRPVAVFSQDATVFGGALGEVYGEKIVKVMDLAAKIGCPSSASTTAAAPASRRASSRSASTATSSCATCAAPASSRRSR
jgi:propionyl-CoA carboxylase beta chain